MPFDDVFYLDKSAIPQERPFEGSQATCAEEEIDGRLPFATYLFPELDDWVPLLQSMAVSPGEAVQWASIARQNGTDFQSELLASGSLGEDRFYRALAADLGTGFVRDVDPERLMVSPAQALSILQGQCRHIPVQLVEVGGPTSYVLAPEGAALVRLRQILRDRPKVAVRLKVVAPGKLRLALISRLRPMLAEKATSSLFDRLPSMSARIVANAWQGSVCGAAVIALPAAIVIAPSETWLGLHLFFSLFFLACVGLRMAAIRSALPQQSQIVEPVLAAELPVYSVLVALYKEAAIVPDLLAALDRLVWPKSKLEIKLVCEEDDAATLAALRSAPLPPSIEIIEVPVFGPRTKPKALAYALPLVSGEFVALYDAEDQPDPLQLMQAWHKFENSAPDLACVQAPLEISNRRGGAVSLMFAFEYAALFRGLLPWLAARRLLLPLGGTSNHFRRSVLEKVGGWDPYNVTEDADLGLRLTRFGYRTEIISCPTHEAAPGDIATWIPQRTRWFKGWVQTWLVHMRNPFRLVWEIGPRSFLIAQILFAGMVLSALAHPFLVVTAFIMAVDLVLARPMGNWRALLFAVDITNIACGYLSFLLLGWQTLKKPERRGFWKVVLLTPPYWMMMSWAAWRAIWQLCRTPHLWEKTPHVRVEPATA